MERLFDRLPLDSLDIGAVDEMVIIGNYGGGNIGDEAMLDVLVESIADIHRSTRIIVPTRHPSTLKKLHPHHPLIAVTMAQGALKAITTDVLLIGGGSIFFEKSGVGTQLLTIVTVLRKLIFRKRFYYYGIGVSPVSSKFLQMFMKISLRLADAVYVRDSSSEKLLADLYGVKKVSRVPDIVFSLKRSENLPNAIRELKDKQSGPIVGLALSVPHTQYDKVLFASIAKFLKYISEKHSATICFLTFYPAFGNSDDSIRGDGHAAELVMEQLPEGRLPNIHILPYYDPATTARVIAELDCVISMRYHGLVLAYRENKPFVSITSDAKHKSFVNDYGGEEIELSNISYNNLLDMWQRLYKPSQ